MIAASRRSILTGLVALVAAPAIVRAGSLMAVKVINFENGAPLQFEDVSMRELTEYVPSDGSTRLDVLYGKLQMRPGRAVEAGRIRDPAAVMEDARRMYSFNSEADCERFYANWMADHAFVTGEQWDKVWFNESTGLLECQANINVRHDGPRLSPQDETFILAHGGSLVPQIPDSLALAAAAVAIAPAVLAKPVTRRFWGK